MVIFHSYVKLPEGISNIQKDMEHPPFVDHFPREAMAFPDLFGPGSDKGVVPAAAVVRNLYITVILDINGDVHNMVTYINIYIYIYTYLLYIYIHMLS